MNDQKFDINSLRVASPCTVGWERMTGDERTRHCELCSLNVYNISELTAVEVQRLVGKREGRLCIRMYRRFDGTVLTKDCPVGLSAVRKRVARFAGATLSAVLGLVSISFGQKDERDPIDGSLVPVVRTRITADAGQMTGSLTDESGALIPSARIVLSLGAQETISTSDEYGNYCFPRLSAGLYHARVSVPGFIEYRIVNLQIRGQERLKLDIRLVGLGPTVGVVATEISTVIEETTLTTLQTVIQPRKPEKP